MLFRSQGSDSSSSETRRGELGRWPFPPEHEKAPLYASRRMPTTMHWSIPWSDLMMTMFIFFAILYLFHAPGKDAPLNKDGSLGLEASEKTALRIDPQARPLEAHVRESMTDLYDVSRRTVEANDLKAFASVHLVPDKAVRIILTGDLLFDTGKADLKPAARALLEDVAEIVRSVPYMVNVVGHTDDVPIHSSQFPTNWELSSTRACTVARFLMEEMGIPEDRFFVTGHAYYQPVQPNTSERNRAANRRVEIIITRERPRAQWDGKGQQGDDVPPDKTKGSAYDRWPYNTF